MLQPFYHTEVEVKIWKKTIVKKRWFISRSEFKYTLISLPFAAAIAFFTRVVLGQVLISSLSIVLVPIATVMLVLKDKCNLSVIGYLMIMLRFNWAKKYYPYKGEKRVM